MNTKIEEVGCRKKKGKGTNKKMKGVPTLKYDRSPIPKKQTKVIISSDEYEDEGEEMDIDIGEKGITTTINKAKEKLKVDKGTLMGGFRLVSPLEIID